MTANKQKKRKIGDNKVKVGFTTSTTVLYSNKFINTNSPYSTCTSYHTTKINTKIMKISAVLLTTLSCVGAFTSGPILSRHHSSSISSLCGKEKDDDKEKKVVAEFVGAKDISALTKDVTTQYTSVEVDSILPHRYPFALIDKVVEIENGKRAVGIKAVSKNEDFFQGHFPGQPVMPGVLQLEALAQLTGIILNTADGIEEGTIGLFGSANDVKWKKPVVPGDLLVMEVEVTKFNKKFGIIKSKGRGYTDGDLAVEVGEMTMILMKPEKK